MKKGFTLVEVLAVVAIIGVLASVILALIDKAKNRDDEKSTITTEQFSEVERIVIDRGDWDDDLEIYNFEDGNAECWVFESYEKGGISCVKMY